MAFVSGLISAEQARFDRKFNMDFTTESGRDLLFCSKLRHGGRVAQGLAPVKVPLFGVDDVGTVTYGTPSGALMVTIITAYGTGVFQTTCKTTVYHCQDTTGTLPGHHQYELLGPKQFLYS